MQRVTCKLLPRRYEQKGTLFCAALHYSNVNERFFLIMLMGGDNEELRMLTARLKPRVLLQQARKAFFGSGHAVFAHMPRPRLKGKIR